MKRIGLFGGTFDPVHLAHLALARSARDALALDELRWIPSGRPWQKARTITPALHREAMLRLAIAGEPGFVLERCELERAGPSYMVDTVAELQRRTPRAQWWLVIGADQLAGFHTWHRWRELAQRVTLAVAQRPGECHPVDEAVAALQITPVPLPEMDISSTEIRRRVAAGLPVASLVPAAVAGYIDRNDLYRGEPRS